MNWHHYCELYDLDTGKVVDVDLSFLCNQFVHSYLFIVAFDEDRQLKGVIVSSDRKRNHEAYLVGVDQIAGIFEAVGMDYPDQVSVRFNPRKGGYDVHPMVSEEAR